MSVDRRLAKLAASIDDANTAKVAGPEVTNIIDFCVDVLGWMPYPAQALALKLAVGASDLLTDDDHARLAEWMDGYRSVDAGHFVGDHGTTPDIVERMGHLADLERWCFRRVVLVLGRRGGKTQISAALVCWQIWRTLALIDPQQQLGIASGKTIAVLVYSTNRDNAGRDIFGDIRRLIDHSPAFAPYVDALDRNRITLFSPQQLASGDNQRGHGSLVIEAAATTASSARGPAVLAVVVDEAAFLDGMGSTADTAELLEAASPALAQFEQQSLTLVVSSPAAKTGRFFDLYERCCAVDSEGNATNPDTMTLHLASWDLYDGWEDAHLHEMIPGGRCYDRFAGPIISKDSAEVDDARRNDDALYRVEYLAQWASVRNAFFPQHAIEAMFAPYRDVQLDKQHLGIVGRRYFMHVDPSDTNANTAVVIAHTDHFAGAEHLVIDFIDVWRPADFDDHTIDYRVVVPDLINLIEAFSIATVSVDSYTGHVLEQWINTALTAKRHHTTVNTMRAGPGEKPARYDHLRSLALQGLVHLPQYELTRLELNTIQQEGTRIGAPTSGPCQTDDTVDALTWIAQQALDPRASTHERFAGLRAARGPGLAPSNPIATAFSSSMGNRGQLAGRDPTRPRLR